MHLIEYYTSCSDGVTFIELNGVIKFRSSVWLIEGNSPTFSLTNVGTALALSIVRIILIGKYNDRLMELAHKIHMSLVKELEHKPFYINIRCTWLARLTVVFILIQEHLCQNLS